MKIAYIYTALRTTGGVDRILTVKANYFAEKMNYEVYIITDSQANRPLIFPISEKVHHIDLNVDFGLEYRYGMFKRFFIYRKLMNKYKKSLKKVLNIIKPDFVLTVCGRDMDFITSIKDGSIKIGESHIAKKYIRNFHLLEEKGFPLKYIAKYWRKKQENAVKKLDTFVVLTRQDAKSWSDVRRALIIPNPLTFTPTKYSNNESKKIISVGRLFNQKGFDLLIKAWAIIAKKHQGWEVNIYGNGELKEYLESLIDKYNIKDSFHIYSPTTNISQKYSESSFYVMPSRFEGFGLVLTEAMSCGLPCISFDCPNGPSDIIKDGEDGFLVQDGNIKSLANKMDCLIENKELRKQMGINAKKNVERYKQEIIMKSWVNLFELFKP